MQNQTGGLKARHEKTSYTMAQSLLKIYIHLIFHIKTTSAVIQDEDLDKLSAYIFGTLNNVNCTAVAVGGMRDHVHLLFKLGAQTDIATIVEHVKIASNKYLHALSPDYRTFAWQAGYGAFSVSPNAIESAIEYVKNQKEHHRDKDFGKEYLMFLRAYKVDHDERYVFRD